MVLIADLGRSLFQPMDKPDSLQLLAWTPCIMLMTTVLQQLVRDPLNRLRGILEIEIYLFLDKESVSQQYKGQLRQYDIDISPLFLSFFEQMLCSTSFFCNFSFTIFCNSFLWQFWLEPFINLKFNPQFPMNCEI